MPDTLISIQGQGSVLKPAHKQIHRGPFFYISPKKNILGADLIMKESKFLLIYTETGITVLMSIAVGGLCTFSILTKKPAVAQVKVYAAPNNNFAEPAQSP